mgnify:FL=1
MNKIYNYSLAVFLGVTSLCTLDAVADDTFLPADQAFRMQAQAKDDHTVNVSFDIADGYYLYKHRFKFAADNNVTIESAELPTGHIKADRNFGTVETYREQLRFPVKITAGNPPYNLTVTAQGCADDGLCYPPFRQTTRIQPAGFETPDSSTTGKPIARETAQANSVEKSTTAAGSTKKSIRRKFATSLPLSNCPLISLIKP